MKELLIPRLGLDLPRFHLRLGRSVHAAQELQLFCVQSTLQLGNDLTGESELLLQSEPFKLAAAVQAALARMRAEPAAHGERLIVELPGWRDAQGRSPFWDGFGARFFGGDPRDCEARFGAAWRSHLAALLPRQTVYLSFLGAEAEACAGRVHDDAQERLHELEAHGFERSGQLRIDDGGPVLWRRP